MTRLDFLQNYMNDLRPYLNDPLVTEIMVNPVEERDGGGYRVFVERDGVMRQVYDVQVHTKSLQALATDIARKQLHREVDDCHPSFSASLDDGSRIAMVIPPASSIGITMTIRKFRPQKFTLEELIACGSISQTHAEIIGRATRARENVLISGSNAAGKTTMLNGLAEACIPRDRRVVCIEEDVREIHLSHENAIHFEASANYSMAALVEDALRHRIQTILIGEVRGKEGMALLNALATGHSGSFATIHGENAKIALDRLTACAMQASELTYQAVRFRVAQAINYVLQMRDRRVVSLHRVGKYHMVADSFELEEIEEREAVQLQEKEDFAGPAFSCRLLRGV